MSTVLTVLVGSPGPAQGVRDVLRDLSAAGLVDRFLWVDDDGSSLQSSGVAATEVVGGEARCRSLAEVLAAHRFERVRLCVLVPLLNGVEPVSYRTETMLADLLASNSGGAEVIRLRLLIARKGGTAAASAVPAVAGWHNLLIAPEDARGPGLGHESLTGDADPVLIGRHAAPMIAGVTGLWSPGDHAPFDDMPVLPGDAIRVVRSFYRRLDASDAEHDLRHRILDVDGHLPLPRDAGNMVVYVDDVELATDTMAHGLWTKYRGVLKGDRVPAPAVPESRSVGFSEALSMFFGFILAALRNAPMAWYSSLTNKLSSAVASTVHSAVFGSAQSAYRVVVNGVTADGRKVGWSDYGHASQQMIAVLGDQHADRSHVGRADLSRLWEDYARGAMTLADAGERSSGLPPAHVGAHRAVVRSSADIVPGPEHRFTEVPGILSANTGVSELDPTDVLGISDFQRQLQALESDPTLGLEARRTSTGVGGWLQTVGRSYGFAFGRILSRELTSTVDEVRRLLAKLQNAALLGDVTDEVRRTQKRLALWAQLSTVVFLVVAVGAGLLAYRDVISWLRGGLVIAAAVLVWAVVLLLVFVRGQQAVFHLINMRRAEADALLVDQANLRTALRDVDRLSGAYGQFLSWSRVVGAFLEEPLGRTDLQRTPVRRIEWGLPRNAAVGSACPTAEQLDSITEFLQRDLFSVGWLTAPWDGLFANAGAALGGLGQDVRQTPSLMLSKPGFGSGSALDVWAGRLDRREIGSSGAEFLWDRAVSGLKGRNRELLHRLLDSIEYYEDGVRRCAGAEDFVAGVGSAARSTQARYFDRTIFTDLASTQGRTSVGDEVVTTVGMGLGMIAITTQYTDGLAVEDLWIGDSATAEPAPANSGPWPDSGGSSAAHHSGTFEPPTLDGLIF